MFSNTVRARLIIGFLTKKLSLFSEQRLRDLYSFDIPARTPDEGVDELLELAGEICEAPISLISLMDRDRQRFKAKKGIDISETPRDVAFCAHTLLQDDVSIVEDASRDIRFRHNPYMTDNLKIRFYAGAPIISENGHNLGTVCLIDTIPRKLDQQQQHLLSIIAKQVSRLIALHKKNLTLKELGLDLLPRKTKSFKKIIHDSIETNYELSCDIHEKVEQTIAPSNFYLRLARQDPKKGDHLLKTAIDQLEGLRK